MMYRITVGTREKGFCFVGLPWPDSVCVIQKLLFNEASKPIIALLGSDELTPVSPLQQREAASHSSPLLGYASSIFPGSLCFAIPSLIACQRQCCEGIGDLCEEHPQSLHLSKTFLMRILGQASAGCKLNTRKPLCFACLSFGTRP